MKVAVLGGGVIGVTTAYYLQQRGHEVVVFDQRGAVGLETSFANAGQISWGYAGPWAAPSVPIEAVTWLFARHAPASVGPGALENLFPHAGPLGEIFYETGLCAMTPTGLPLVQRTRHDNLFVNTGHGAFGWTMACATGQIVANLVSLRARSKSRAPLSLTEAAAGAS